MGKLARLWPSLGAPTPFDVSCGWVSSPFFSPAILAISRLSIALYTLTTIIVILAQESVSKHEAQTFFSYFTNLSYIGMCAYFWAAATQTTVFAMDPAAMTYPLQRWGKFLQVSHVVLWSSVTTFAPLITIVYWSLLANASTFKSRFSAWQQLSVHALNTPFAIFEICLTSSGPQPLTHLIFLILVLGGYLGVAYITRATQGFYPYDFLNPHKEGSHLAIYIIGVPAVAIVSFAIIRTICKLKIRLLPALSEVKPEPTYALSHL